jgi:hypothetical protein
MHSHSEFTSPDQPTGQPAHHAADGTEFDGLDTLGGHAGFGDYVDAGDFGAESANEVTTELPPIRIGGRPSHALPDHAEPGDRLGALFDAAGLVSARPEHGGGAEFRTRPAGGPRHALPE